MTTPRPRSDDVRARILQAATRLLAARGFEGTSLQDIADAVGMRKPSLLYHFPSKEALRQAVLEGILAHWRVALPRILHAAASGEDQFDGVLGELVRFFADDPDRARLLLRELLDRPRDMGAIVRGPVRPWVDSLAHHIRAGQAHGDLHGDVDPEAYVLHVMTMVISVCATSRLRAIPRERTDRELVRLARAALFVSPEPGASRRKRGP